MSDAQSKRSLHIYTAKSTRKGGKAQVVESQGNVLMLDNYRGGYVSHHCRLSRDVDIDAIMSGQDLGEISLEVEEGDNKVARWVIEGWRLSRTEIVAVYRESDPGKPEKTITMRGYISSATIGSDPSSIKLEVHSVQISGNGRFANRIPVPLDPPGGYQPPGWGRLLNG